MRRAAQQAWRGDVLLPGQRAEAAISGAAEEGGVMQAGEGAAGGGRGAGAIDKASGEGSDAGGNSGRRVANELSKVQQPRHAVGSAGKAPAEEGEAKARDAGKGALHASEAGGPGSRESAGRRLAIGEGDAHGGGGVNQRHATAGSGGRQGRIEGRGDSTKGENAGLGGVQVLAGGVSKSVHGRKESGDLCGGLQQHLGIIGIGASGGSARGAGQEVRDANAA